MSDNIEEGSVSANIINEAEDTTPLETKTDPPAKECPVEEEQTTTTNTTYINAELAENDDGANKSTSNLNEEGASAEMKKEEFCSKKEVDNTDIHVEVESAQKAVDSVSSMQKDSTKAMSTEESSNRDAVMIEKENNSPVVTQNCNKSEKEVEDETSGTQRLAETTPIGSDNSFSSHVTEEEKNAFKESSENVTYTEDGIAIYTDPKTNYKYKWSEEQNNWIPLESSDGATDTKAVSNPFENEHYKWDAEKNEWIAKAQVTETEHYKWDAEKNKWIPKVQTKGTEITYDIDEQGQRIYTDKDGTVFFWDKDKNAWFPKIDDDFMARYQMNYGFIDNTSESEEEKRLKEEKEAKRKEEEFKVMAEEARAGAAAAASTTAGTKRKAPQEPPKWFELTPENNTKVYVSNLPLDITLDEFAEVMGKCGMVMRDPQTQKYKLKLYTEADGQIKGDGLCDYIKVESVDLALNILDGYILRGSKLHVQRAEFQMRGDYNPALKPKRKKKDKEKLLKMKEKLFDWRPEKMRGERSKNEKVVIIKNLFHPDIFEKEVQLILDYQNDLREECSKCGTVRKVVIYDRHAEGVAQINMASPEEADVVIQMMQGRFFGKRQLQAEHWDGKTKYKIFESETDAQKRLTNWDEFLQDDEQNKKCQTAEEVQKSNENLMAEKTNENVQDSENVTEQS